MPKRHNVGSRKSRSHKQHRGASVASAIKQVKKEPSLVSVLPASLKHKTRTYAPLFSPRQACVEFHEILQDTSYKLADLKIVYGPNEDKDSMYVHSKTVCSQSAYFESLFKKHFGKGELKRLMNQDMGTSAHKGGGTCSQQQKQQVKRADAPKPIKSMRIKEKHVDPDMFKTFLICLSFPRMDNKERVLFHGLQAPDGELSETTNLTCCLDAVEDAVHFMYLCGKWKVQWNMRPLQEILINLFAQFNVYHTMMMEQHRANQTNECPSLVSCAVECAEEQFHSHSGSSQEVDSTVSSVMCAKGGVSKAAASSSREYSVRSLPPVCPISKLFTPPKSFWELCSHVFDSQPEVHEFLSTMQWKESKNQGKMAVWKWRH